MKRIPPYVAVVLALIVATPTLAQTGSSSGTGSNDGYRSAAPSGGGPSSPLGYLAIGGSAALFGGLWLTRRHRARGQVSW
jgi:hypothetical protein